MGDGQRPSPHTLRPVNPSITTSSENRTRKKYCLSQTRASKQQILQCLDPQVALLLLALCGGYDNC
ncbi:hypothetical protein E2C01_064707 [Portunus trituberculatus]|uniref:Uncharacterized protein n=1 Tax=Portunus trituberculatus TaxID=210409 RepID=A0A5B7HP39_PORTR|nr:hypothetical protein [Portunus trituberculatus]